MEDNVTAGKSTRELLLALAAGLGGVGAMLNGSKLYAFLSVAILTYLTYEHFSNMVLLGWKRFWKYPLSIIVAACVLAIWKHPTNQAPAVTPSRPHDLPIGDEVAKSPGLESRPVGPKNAIKRTAPLAESARDMTVNQTMSNSPGAIQVAGDASFNVSPPPIEGHYESKKIPGPPDYPFGREVLLSANGTIQPVNLVMQFDKEMRPGIDIIEASGPHLIYSDMGPANGRKVLVTCMSTPPITVDGPLKVRVYSKEDFNIVGIGLPTRCP